MSIDLKQLAAEAERYRSAGKRPRYPQSFRRKVVGAMASVSPSKLGQMLGLGRSTLSVWQHRLSHDSQQAKEPKFVEVIAAPSLEHADRYKPCDAGLLVHIAFNDGDGRCVRLELPCQPATVASAFELIQRAIVERGRK